MSESDDFIKKLRAVFDGANISVAPVTEAKKNIAEKIFENPAVVAVIGGIAVFLITNSVTMNYQAHDQKSQAVAALETNLPKEIGIQTSLAYVRAEVEDSNCNDIKNKDQKIDFPFILGMTGMTCQEADRAYAARAADHLEKSSGTSLSRLRALFSSSAVKDGAIKTQALLDVLSQTKSAACILQISQHATRAYDALMDLSIQEVNGKPSNATSPVFDLDKYEIQDCEKDEVLCSVPSIASNPVLKCK